MKRCLVSTVIAFGVLLAAQPSQAQHARHRAAVYHKTSSVGGKKSVGTRSQMIAISSANLPTAEPSPQPQPSYKVVRGVVQGKDGALPGATVWLQGTRTVVVTNSEGEFELQVPADAKTVKLTCSYGGLQEEEVTTAPVQAMGSVYLLRTKDLGRTNY